MTQMIKRCQKAFVAMIGMILMTSSHAITYSYDSLNRLTSVNYDSKQFINYTYDDGGNIIDVETNIFLYTIHGRLLDKQGEPIKQALVQVDKRAFAITDSNGYWEIIDLPEGRYNLTAKKEGFAFLGQDFEVGNQDWITEHKIPVLSEFKLRIVPEFLKKPAEQGKKFRFSITAVNGGDRVATDASVVYSIPDNTELVKIRGLGDVTCDGIVSEENETTCLLPDLPIGAMAEIKVEIYLELSDPLGPYPILKNVATLYSNYPNIDVAKRWTPIQPYLSVFCEGNPDPIVLGGLLHYECDIELNDNAPEAVATGVHFKMQLPDELRPEFVTTTSESHICDTSDWPTLNCPIGELSVADITMVRTIFAENF
jgi:YD repeat-containing protein